MNGRVFFDTNIAVYAFDSDAPAKRDKALELLAAARAGSHVVSAQVLQEFFNAVTRTLARPLGLDAADAAVHLLSSSRRPSPVVANACSRRTCRTACGSASSSSTHSSVEESLWRQVFYCSLLDSRCYELCDPDAADTCPGGQRCLEQESAPGVAWFGVCG